MAKLGEYGERFPTMSLQEIYSVAREHLLTQMKQSGEVDYHGHITMPLSSGWSSIRYPLEWCDGDA